MAYITAVTDHEATDYFNIADWERIYNNARLMIDNLNINYIHSFGWTEIAHPTTASFPSHANFNTLLANIETARAGMANPAITSEIFHDWQAGLSKHSPDYSDVNLWESVIDSLWTLYNGPYIPVCPTLTSDLNRSDIHVLQTYIDCIDMGVYKTTLDGSFKLYII